jgi:hypothetical protein
MGEEEAVLSCLLATTTHTGKGHSRGEWMEEWREEREGCNCMFVIAYGLTEWHHHIVNIENTHECYLKLSLKSLECSVCCIRKPNLRHSPIGSLRRVLLHYHNTLSTLSCILTIYHTLFFPVCFGNTLLALGVFCFDLVWFFVNICYCRCPWITDSVL